MAGISIALATHNGEKYLPEQLQSLARQTKSPAELVISDDRSQDSTLEIVNAFAAQAAFPVRVLSGASRLGFRDNFMRAATACRSELVAFCDQDDVWEPNKIAVMERVFHDPNVMLGYHNATLTSARGAAIGQLYRGRGVRVFEPLSRDPWLVVPGFMQVFRRELTAFNALHADSYDVDWPGHPMAHDRWFVFLASVLGRIVYVGEPLVRYRQHETNVYGFYPDARAQFDRLARGIRFIRAAASAAGNRAELLRRLSADLDDRGRAQSIAGAVYYDRMRGSFEGRKAVYVSATYRARVKALFGLWRQGCYGSTHGSAGFTWWDFLLDFYLAAPLGPRLRRLLRK